MKVQNPRLFVLAGAYLGFVALIGLGFVFLARVWIATATERTQRTLAAQPARPVASPEELAAFAKDKDDQKKLIGLWAGEAKGVKNCPDWDATFDIRKEGKASFQRMTLAKDTEGGIYDFKWLDTIKGTWFIEDGEIFFEFRDRYISGKYSIESADKFVVQDENYGEITFYRK